MLYDIPTAVVELQQGRNTDRAFNTLYVAYKPFVLGMIRKVTRNADIHDDICQEVFLKLHRHVQSYRARSAFRTWLGAIARNTALNYVKTQKALPEDAQCHIDANEEGFDALMSSTCDTPEQHTEAYETAECMLSAYDSLESGQQRTFMHIYGAGLNYHDCALRTGVPVGTVRSRLARAVQTIKQASEV